MLGIVHLIVILLIIIIIHTHQLTTSSQRTLLSGGNELAFTIEPGSWTQIEINRSVSSISDGLVSSCEMLLTSPNAR